MYLYNMCMCPVSRKQITQDEPIVKLRHLSKGNVINFQVSSLNKILRIQLNINISGITDSGNEISLFNKSLLGGGEMENRIVVPEDGWYKFGIACINRPSDPECNYMLDLQMGNEVIF